MASAVATQDPPQTQAPPNPPAEQAAEQAGAPAAETAVPDAAPQAAPAAGGVDVHDAQLPQVPETRTTGAPGQIDILLDTPIIVQAHLGEVQLQIKDLLQVGAGSVIKLDKQVGEPVELFMRGVCFAKGHLVVVGEQLGVRICEILSQEAKI